MYVRVKKRSIEMFKRVLPWLDELPQSILERLCLDEFILPSSAEADEIHKLAEIIGCYIMPYSLTTFRRDLPPDRHLCANINSASLSPAQLELFLDKEKSFKSRGITLSAYERPLKLILPLTI